MKAIQDVLDDLIRIDYGDSQINYALESLYNLYQAKGLPYRELFKSKFFGTVKYLVFVEGPKVTITDLDTNDEYHTTINIKKKPLTQKSTC